MRPACVCHWPTVSAPGLSQATVAPAWALAGTCHSRRAAPIPGQRVASAEGRGSLSGMATGKCIAQTGNPAPGPGRIGNFKSQTGASPIDFRFPPNRETPVQVFQKKTPGKIGPGGIGNPISQ